MKKTTKLIFFGLSFYVIAQFVWWAFLLMNIEDQFELRNPGMTTKGFWMIVGEGLVFLILLLAGLAVFYLNLRQMAKKAAAETNFMLAITHELKTPLASNRLLLQTLKYKKLSENQRLEILDSALSENHRLSSLTENILLAAQIERDDNTLSKYAVNLTRVLQDIETYARNSFGKNHHLTFALEKHVYILGDETSVQVVCSNLIENACKYSPKGSTVDVRLERTNNDVLLKVGDEGSGIPESEKKRIFDKFYRVGDENVRKTQGTGLGLYIAELILKWHHGKIMVDENTPKGSIFTASFPLMDTIDEKK